MHQFLKSVGFGNLTELEEQDRLLRDVLLHYDYKKVVETENGHLFAEIAKEYAPDIGIMICGEYDKENLFRMEYYYPYFHGSQVTTYEQIGIERHLRTTSFAVACDDIRVGTTVIFYLTNAGEYLETTTRKIPLSPTTSVSLAGLADSGSILLPVIKDQKTEKADAKKLEQRNSLFAAAQKGDEEAIENLTMEDIDAYSMISRRIQYEDVYTIVDSYLIPYGLECDLYNILGDITDVDTFRNSMTQETMIRLGLNCNDIPLDVCINERDLLGAPEPGRRFKGIVWLQGNVYFE
ncbi:MAG: DUF3881 family protein [Eubacterium sp.]|nr:DUF3881 family protein [Eubacterium sp.]